MYVTFILLFPSLPRLPFSFLCALDTRSINRLTHTRLHPVVPTETDEYRREEQGTWAHELKWQRRALADDPAWYFNVQPPRRALRPLVAPLSRTWRLHRGRVCNVSSRAHACPRGTLGATSHATPRAALHLGAGPPRLVCLGSHVICFCCAFCHNCLRTRSYALRSVPCTTSSRYANPLRVAICFPLSHALLCSLCLPFYRLTLCLCICLRLSGGCDLYE